MKTYTSKVVVEPDEDALGNPAWHAYCPALESLGAATSGRTKDEALKNINEVIRMIVEESPGLHAEQRTTEEEIGDRI